LGGRPGFFFGTGAPASISVFAILDSLTADALGDLDAGAALTFGAGFLGLPFGAACIALECAVFVACFALALATGFVVDRTGFWNF